MDVLRYDEQAIMRLRALYRQFGYTQYRMSRFEEYELYADNKTFLASGEIITFTGAGGKLMALRPDVTLSIVKNAKDNGALKKLYYNENVYRPDGYEFREHMQVGLECIGDLDVYSMGETLILARRSLEMLNARSCLDVSHMGFINGLLGEENLAPEQRAEILRCLSARNMHELNALCGKYGFADTFRDRISKLTELYGPYGEVIGKLKSLNVNEETGGALEELEAIYGILRSFKAEKDINLDFSIVNDLRYYNGIIFHGYIEGIPAKVLSGGRYDELLRKFGKSSGAIGFAVYLDLLERLNQSGEEEEVDVLLIYGNGTAAEDLANAVMSITDSGKSVRVQRGDPGNIKHKEIIELL